MKTILNKNLGEVMLHRKWSRKLLEIIDKSCFGNDEYVFFEFSCGTGNIVIEIINKQFYAFLDKIENKEDYPNVDMYGNLAIIKTLNNLFAIDINEKFIEICRKRVLRQINFLLSKCQSSGKCVYNSYFMKEIEKAVNYHIHMNEMLSCLKDDYQEAKKAAQKTRASREFFDKYGHSPIDFNKGYFEQ